MIKRTPETQPSIRSTNSLVNVILVTNAFVWYFFVITILKNVVGNFQSPLLALQIWGIHFLAIVISAIIGANFAGRIHNRSKFLVFWMILGMLSSVFSLFLDVTYVSNALAIAFLLGLSLGIGMPSCMGYFTESIKIENRGRIGGIIMLISGLGMIGLATISEGNSSLQELILVLWRTFGLIAFLALQGKVKNIHVNLQSSYKTLINYRPFLLYFVPWIMFSLITYLTLPIQTKYLGQAEADYLIMWDNVITGVFAIAGGFLIDILGRKRMSIVGFAMLGTAYAVLGLFYDMRFSWYFYTIIDGVAWGIFYVIFVVIIWGDLSQGKASDKYYAIGVLPFFVSNFIRLTVGNNLGDYIPTAAIFSFIAFFLFLAVLPLVYAPETLPEKQMKDRELKSYIEKAQKMVDKEQEKNKKHRKNRAKSNEEEQPTQQNSEEYEKAKQLAEKYY